MTKHFLVDPNAEIVNRKLPTFTDNLLGDDSRKDIANALEKEMTKYGGIGLSANQIGLPFRMFVMGGHPQIEEGKVRQCWNPEIIEASEEMVEMKEGCLTFPFLFLPIIRPKWVKVKYENDDKEIIEEYLHDMTARIFQHEWDHMEGVVFTSLVSKEKLKYYEKKRKKAIKNATRNKTKPTRA
jgi:peptide deformylase